MRTFFQCCQIVGGSQRNFRKISEDKSARVKTVGRQCFRRCYRPSLNISNSLKLCSQVLLRTPPQLQQMTSDVYGIFWNLTVLVLNRNEVPIFHFLKEAKNWGKVTAQRTASVGDK